MMKNFFNSYKIIFERKSEKYFGYSREIKITNLDMKKNVIKHYGHLVFANNGFIEVEADTDTLDFIYKSGMLSSRNAEGFGLLEVVR